MSHTPRPWSYTIHNADMPDGCFKPVDLHRPGMYMVRISERGFVDDARLIAAAPELLTVLSEIVDAIDFDRGAGKENAADATRLLIAARAAIASATGAA